MLKTGMIDNQVALFKSNPEMFEDNRWNCYSKCKLGIPESDSDTYYEYIEYIVKKLEL